jgi:hypothetical protein
LGSPESYPKTLADRRRREEVEALWECLKERLVRRLPNPLKGRKQPQGASAPTTSRTISGSERTSGSSETSGSESSSGSKRIPLREQPRERFIRWQSRRLRERLIRIQAAEPISHEGAAAIDEVCKRAVRRIPEDHREKVDRRLFFEDGYTVRGPGGPRWMVGRRISYEPRELKVTCSDDAGDVLALRVAVALGDELDTARFRLLSEQRDLFHEADRLSAEGEFRLAVSPALAFIAVALISSESLLWLMALGPIYILILLGIARQEQSGDRIVYAIRADKVKTPILERLTAETPKA